MFEKVPDSIIVGQRAVYQGLTISEINTNKIIDTYIKDCKSLIIYHVNFIFESKIKYINLDDSISKSDRLMQLEDISIRKNEQIEEAFKNIERLAETMRSTSMQNYSVTKKITSSIYSYLSSAAIEVDNIPFLIKQFKVLN